MADNPLTICGSADNIVFQDGVFDGCVFTDVLEHIPPEMEDKVVKEIYRVIKPGGWLYVDYPGSKLPYYSGYLVINLGIAFLRLFGKNIRYYTMDREPEAHVNLSFPHKVNGLFARNGFLGRLIPKTTKFYSLSPKLQRIAWLTNIFPLNYLFSVQLMGKLYKPQ